MFSSQRDAAINNSKKIEHTELTNQSTSALALYKTLTAGLGIIVVMVLTSYVSYNFWQTIPTITAENALMELLQGSFLLATAMIHALLSVREKKYPLARLIRIGISLFTVALFLREVDVDKLGSSPLWHITENIARVITTLLILIYLGYSYTRIKSIIGNLRTIICSPVVLVTSLACFIYACGWVFDKELFAIEQQLSVFIEETIELNAALLIFLGAFTSAAKPESNQSISHD